MLDSEHFQDDGGAEPNRTPLREGRGVSAGCMAPVLPDFGSQKSPKNVKIIHHSRFCFENVTFCQPKWWELDELFTYMLTLVRCI